MLSLALLLLAAPDDLETGLKRIVDVFMAVEAEAADPVSSERAFFGGAIPGMLRKLDPHSVFFDPDNFEQLKRLQTSKQRGFGSVVSVLPGRVIVLQAVPGAPMARSGVSPGDEIVAINGIRLDTLEMEQLIELLGAARNQQVKIDVRRSSNARTLQFLLTPEEMQAPSVERAFQVQPGVGYIRVGSFDVETGKQIHDAIEKLGGAALKGLVLDLRNNPGGVLGAAIETSSLFLKSGQTILSVKGRKVADQDLKVQDNNTPYEFPVAVIVNGKSASASEIVAAAVQDHKRGKVIGEQSFGKGLVESVYPLSMNTGIALTTSYYYTPDGRSLQKPLKGGTLDETTARNAGGVRPDIVAQPEGVTRLRMVLDATGSFANFATEFLRKQGAITPAFDLSGSHVDQFKAFVSERRIQPSVSEWSSESEWIRGRLKQEIFNQALGVEKGDEVEARSDPQIQAAVQSLGIKE